MDNNMAHSFLKTKSLSGREGGVETQTSPLVLSRPVTAGFTRHLFMMISLFPTHIREGIIKNKRRENEDVDGCLCLNEAVS